MKKKIVSLMLTGVMFASMSLTAFAGDTTEFTAADGSKEVEKDAVVNYVNTTVYKVTLPTANCFDFIVDPQGILSAVDEAKTTYTEELYPEGTAGYIVPKEETGAYINNKSSIPIKLMVDAHVEGGATAGAPSDASLLGLEEFDLVNSGIDNNILLTFDITNESVFYNADGEYKPELFGADDGDKEKLITSKTVNPNVIAITKNGLATGETGTQISFALNKAEYKFEDNAGTYEYNLVTGEPGDTVGMRLSGFVNTNADWKDFSGASPTKKITVKTLFSFSDLSTDYEAAALDGRAYGTLADADPQYFAGVNYDETTGLPDGTTVTESMDYAIGQGALEIPFDFGTGTKEVGIDPTASIAVGDTPVVLTPADYKINNGVISIKTSAIKDELEAAETAAKAAADGFAVMKVVITTTDKLPDDSANVTTTVNVNVYPGA